tara:strand:- start:823 stop:1038 length:216 start_codon:yes stop_codon:yes gene_type:complete
MVEFLQSFALELARNNGLPMGIWAGGTLALWYKMGRVEKAANGNGKEVTKLREQVDLIRAGCPLCDAEDRT